MRAIDVQHVTKQFGSSIILNDVCMELDSGKIYGLVGDNGSGKTVLLKCICGLMIPDAGKVLIEGKEVGLEKNPPPMIGVLIEHPGFLGNFSGLRNLQYLAGIRGIAKQADIQQALSLVDLSEQAQKKVSHYSLGMRQRLAIAQAIMEKPSVYIMDEPFNGLDRGTTAKIHGLLKTLRDNGSTFLLVSHHTEDISDLCDVVFEIDGGRVFEKEVKQFT